MFAGHPVTRSPACSALASVAFHARFAATSAGPGFGATVTRLQWSALAKVTALAGLAPDQVTQAVIDDGRQALAAAIGRHHPASHGPTALSAALFGLQNPAAVLSAAFQAAGISPKTVVALASPPRWVQLLGVLDHRS
jgi:hypothetical protein